MLLFFSAVALLALLALFLVHVFAVRQRFANVHDMGLWWLLANALNIEQATKPHAQKKLLLGWAGWLPQVIITDAQLAKEILVNSELFPKDFPLNPKSCIYPLTAHGMNNVNGAVWKRHRAVVGPAFQFKVLKGLTRVFATTTNEFLQALSLVDQNPVNMTEWIHKFTMDVLGNAAFGQSFGAMKNENTIMLEAYKGYMAGILNPVSLLFPFLEKLPLPFSQRLVRSTATLTEFYRSLINKRFAERKAQAAGAQAQDTEFRDLLDQFVTSLTQEDPNVYLSDEELLTSMNLFYIAGHDTTAIALSYQMYFLGLYPDIQEAIHKEIIQAIGDAVPTFEDTKNVPTLTKFIHESLRMSPSIGYMPSRIAAETVTIGEKYVIPKGTSIALGIYAIHHNPDYWENPEEFNLERWSHEQKKGRHPYAFVPFSMGPRACIGQSFSLLEQHITLMIFLRRYKVILLDKKCEKQKITPIFNFPGPIPVKLERRPVIGA